MVLGGEVTRAPFSYRLRHVVDRGDNLRLDAVSGDLSRKSATTQDPANYRRMG